MTKAVFRDSSRSSGVRLIELPDPGSPGPGQVRVRMLMAPVNPADRIVIAGGYAAPGGLPEIIGAEGVGQVEEVGAGIAGIGPGERVMLMSRGNWASHRMVGAEEIMPVPNDLDDAQSAMLRINPATAWRLLHRLRLPEGAWLIQNAAGSSVARWVRRLARRRGIRTVNVVRRSPLDADGDPVLPDGDDLAGRAAALAAGAPILGALDAVAGEATGRLAECLAPAGEILVFGHLSGRPCSIASTLLTAHGLSLAGFSLRPAEAGESEAQRRLVYAELAEILAGAPEPVSAVFGLGDIERALAARPAGGRVLLALDR